LLFRQLPEGTPVAGAMFDIDACALAIGITDEDNIYSIGGTTHADCFYGQIPCTRAIADDEVKTGYEKNTGIVPAKSLP